MKVRIKNCLQANVYQDLGKVSIAGSKHQELVNYQENSPQKINLDFLGSKPEG